MIRWKVLSQSAAVVIGGVGALVGASYALERILSHWAVVGVLAALMAVLIGIVYKGFTRDG